MCIRCNNVLISPLLLTTVSKHESAHHSKRRELQININFNMCALLNHCEGFICNKRGGSKVFRDGTKPTHHFGKEHFSKSHFGVNVCFITGTFRHLHHLGLLTFRQMDYSTRECFDMGTFRHKEFSAQ